MLCYKKFQKSHEYIYMFMLFERTRSNKWTEAYISGMERLCRPCYQRSHRTRQCRLKTCNWYRSFSSECSVAYCCMTKSRNRTIEENTIESKSHKFVSRRIERNSWSVKHSAARYNNTYFEQSSLVVKTIDVAPRLCFKDVCRRHSLSR